MTFQKVFKSRSKGVLACKGVQKGGKVATRDRSPRENHTNKYSTYHDEEHAESEHTHTGIIRLLERRPVSNARNSKQRAKDVCACPNLFTFQIFYTRLNEEFRNE